jgi:hypothetical protein
MELKKEFKAIEDISFLLNTFSADECERIINYCNNFIWQKRREEDEKKRKEVNSAMQTPKSVPF